MPFPLIPAIIGGTIAGAWSSSKAADAQGDAANKSADVQLQINQENIAANQANLDKILEFEQANLDKQMELTQPWRDAGLEALDYIRTGLADGSLTPETIQEAKWQDFDYDTFVRQDFEKPNAFQYDEFQYDKFEAPPEFTYDRFDAPDPYERAEFNFEADPGYQFRLDEGLKARQRQAAARGRNASPATEKALDRYSQGLAAQEYGNAFNRYLNTTDRDFQEYATNYQNQYQDYYNNLNFSYDVYSDNYDRQYTQYLNDRGFDRAAYDADRNFSYGVYGDQYERDYRDYLDDENQRYDQYLKTGYFLADQNEKKQLFNYQSEIDAMNSRNAGKANLLNTAIGVTNLGQGATAQQVGANANYGSGVANAFNSTNAANNASRTATGNNVSQALLSGGNAKAGQYTGIANSVNQGMENYLLYQYLS